MKDPWPKLALFILIGVMLCAIGFVGLHHLVMQRLWATKSVRELTGVVIGKGYRKFEKENAARVENGQYFYADEEGRLGQRYPGDEDWLIHYEVERFDPRDEPMSTRLLENEKKRVASGKYRTAIVTKEEYDQIGVGERIYARYQRFSDSNVMIWGCEKRSSLPASP